MSEGKKLKRRVPKERTVSLVDFNQEPNSAAFISQIKTLCMAACGVIMVRTAEEHRAILSIAEFCAMKKNTEMLLWRISDGWTKINTEPTAPPVASSMPSSLTVGFGNASQPVPGSVDFEAEEDETMMQEIDVSLYPEDNNRPTDYMIPNPMVAIDWLTSPTGHFSMLNDAVPKNRLPRDGDPVRKGAVYVMTAPDMYLAEPGMMESIKKFATLALDDDIRLFLICGNSTEVPERIYEDVRTVEFKPPNPTELLVELQNALENFEIDDSSDEFEFELDDAEKQRVVRNALGLSVTEFNNAISLALVNQADTLDGSDSIDVDGLISSVRDAKLEMLKKNPILEYKEPVPIEDIGGLDLLKNFIRKRKKAFSAEARAFGVDAPRGILVVGPPGTGKSMMAKAISSVMEVPCVLLDIGKVFGGLVGQSEGQMRSALKTVDAMAPCVLLIDEIDKGFSNTSGGGDSGTSARVFGTFLTWMQERKSDDSPVMVVFTANNAEHLPPELVRKGRVDEIFHAPFPTEQVRVQTLRIHFNKRGHDYIEDEDLERIAAITDGFVGAELESLVKEAILDAFDEDAEQVEYRHMQKVAEDIRPLKNQYADLVERMDKWAELNARPASSKEALPSVKPMIHKPGINRASGRKIKTRSSRN